MTHAELDALGPKLQAQINDAIAEQHPLWSRYAVEAEIEKLLTEMAPDWEYLTSTPIGSTPSVVLTQYRGRVI